MVETKSPSPTASNPTERDFLKVSSHADLAKHFKDSKWTQTLTNFYSNRFVVTSRGKQAHVHPLEEAFSGADPR